MEIRKYWLHNDKGFIIAFTKNKPYKIDVTTNSLTYNGKELEESLKEKIRKLIKIEIDNLDVSTTKEVYVGFMRTKTVMSKTAIRNSYIKDYFYRALNLKEIQEEKNVQTGINIKIIDIFMEQFKLKIIVEKDNKRHTLHIKDEKIYFNDIMLKEKPEILVLQKTMNFLEKKSTILYSTKKEALMYSNLQDSFFRESGLLTNSAKYEKVFKKAKEELI
ncbi:hypothetical protein SAMN02745174_02623 [Cetobacterium ceti]|uniref:Uncharacterized protein n=1 Tax=Cetobacterium ceti TaxID=180163 RepID=A0A1T4R9U7_9FUSO|nr:hypothetical protein [Cetobacterium ceti]SKA12448.1 hypothetical protein SAMN02745174_02623 [Cetobacterium ceti]